MTAVRDNPRRHWLRLATRIAGLMLHQPGRTSDLVRDSYDRIADGYDSAWTDHMRDLSSAMLDRLTPPPGATCLDLSCGTGLITAELARRTGGACTGVDASAGMLAVARRRRVARCRFVHADVLYYLRRQPRGSVDVVTCGWALGYSRPAAVIAQTARVLRPGGRVGIIDNSLFSLAGVLWASLQAFAERPAALQHAAQVRFLPHSAALAALMRGHGLGVRERWDGARTYEVSNGTTAVQRLQSTGAAAGFEFAVGPEDREAVFARFAELIERQRRGDGGVPVTHRYLAAVGVKRCAI